MSGLSPHFERLQSPAWQGLPHARPLAASSCSQLNRSPSYVKMGILQASANLTEEAVADYNLSNTISQSDSTLHFQLGHQSVCVKEHFTLHPGAYLDRAAGTPYSR